MSSYYNNYITGGQHSPIGASPPFSPQYGDPTSPVSATNGSERNPFFDRIDRMDALHGLDMTMGQTGAINMNNNYYHTNSQQAHQQNHTTKLEYDHNRNTGRSGGVLGNGLGYSSITGGKSDLASLPCSEPYTGGRHGPAVSGGNGLNPAVSPPPVGMTGLKLPGTGAGSQGTHEAVSSPSPPSAASTPQPPQQPRASTTPPASSASQASHTTSATAPIHHNTTSNHHPEHLGDRSPPSRGSYPGATTPTTPNHLLGSPLGGGAPSHSPGASSKEDADSKKSVGSPGDMGSDEGGEGSGGSKAGIPVYPWMRSQFGEYSLFTHNTFFTDCL